MESTWSIVPTQPSNSPLNVPGLRVSNNLGPNNSEVESSENKAQSHLDWLKLGFNDPIHGYKVGQLSPQLLAAAFSLSWHNFAAANI